MKFSKYVSLLIVISTLLSVFTSCGKRIDKKMEKGAKQLEKHPYRVEVSIDFSDADAEIAKLFEELEKNKTTLYFDGDSFKAVNETEIAVGEKQHSFTTVYTGVGGVLYRYMKHSSDSGIKGNEKKERTSLSAEQSESIVGRMCLIGAVRADGFGEVNVTKLGNKRLSALYTSPDDSVKEELCKMMVRLLENSCDSVVFNSATLTVNLLGKEYESAAVECGFDVTFGDKTYTVECVIRLKLERDDSINIAAPTDAREYEMRHFDEIITD